MEDAMLIAKNLRRLIYESGQSPADVARGMNINKTTLSNWMTGYRTPRMYNIDAIAEYLGVSREAIVGTGDAQKDTVKIPIYGYVRAGIPSHLRQIRGNAVFIRGSEKASQKRCFFCITT